MNSTYDGSSYVMPEGYPADWQDGYGDAMFHHARGHGSLLDMIIADDNPSGEYEAGYRRALQDIRDYEAAGTEA